MFIIAALPLNFSFDSAYAAAVVKIRDEKTTLPVISRLLNTYFDSGMPADLEALNSCLKLSSVGWVVINLGGKANSSSIGLNAWKMMNTIGSPVSITRGSTSSRILI